MADVEPRPPKIQFPRQGGALRAPRGGSYRPELPGQRHFESIAAAKAIARLSGASVRRDIGQNQAVDGACHRVDWKPPGARLERCALPQRRASGDGVRACARVCFAVGWLFSTMRAAWSHAVAPSTCLIALSRRRKLITRFGEFRPQIDGVTVIAKCRDPINQDGSQGPRAARRSLGVVWRRSARRTEIGISRN